MLITFGGAFSNHILATAAYAKKKNIDCLAIVRGEEYFELNPLLTLAKKYGMNFCFVSRKEYAKRNNIKYLSELARKYKKALDIFCKRLSDGLMPQSIVQVCAQNTHYHTAGYVLVNAAN